jgi:hypothetical protein
MPLEKVLGAVLLLAVEYPTTERVVVPFQEIFVDTAVHIAPCEISMVEVLDNKWLYQLVAVWVEASHSA